VGRHIVFNEGRYAPHTPEGMRLLAHEATHVVQQSAGVRSDRGGGEAFEHQADQVAAAVLRGSPTQGLLHPGRGGAPPMPG
jgi:hypothetical protein